MRYAAHVDVTHLPGVLDPQGATVQRALPALGYDNVSDVSIGKTIRLVVDAPDEGAARAQVEEMCERLLANPVIEAYEISISELGLGMSLDVAIVLFPGTNCELDVAYAVDRLGGTPTIVFHTERDLGGADAVIVPGGFAHGDYLRTGAIARFSPIMDAVAAFARDGGPVVGICNGFQVLTEAQLLPGALQKNAGLRFLCTTVEVEIASTRSALTNSAAVGDVLRLPINHFEGNYTCDAATLERLRDGDCVVARYVDNPNGIARRHRRHQQRRRQRRRAHAAPRARGRGDPRLGRRRGAAAVAPRRGRDVRADRAQASTASLHAGAAGASG